MRAAGRVLQFSPDPPTPALLVGSGEAVPVMVTVTTRTMESRVGMDRGIGS